MRLDWGDQFPGRLPTVRDPLAGIASTLDATGERTTAATRPVEPKGVFSYPTNSSSINRRPDAYYGWVLPPDDLIILSEATGTVSAVSGNGIIVTDSLGNTHYQDIDPLYDITVSVSAAVTAGVTTVATLSTEADTKLLPTVELDAIEVSEGLTYYYVNVLLERGPRIRARLPRDTVVNAYDPIIAFPSAIGDWLGYVGNTEPVKFFELKDALVPGGTADAYPIGGDGEPITDDANLVFEVKDVRGVYRGRAKDAYADPHAQGSRGEARLRNGVWEIVYLTPHALAIRGQLTADLVDTDSTFDIDNVIILQPEGAIIVDQDPAGPLTVNNTFTHEGDNKGLARADWNQSSGGWDSLQTACKVSS